jgi:hypothetical protein
MSEAEAMELVKLHAEPERDPKLSEYELQRLLLSLVVVLALLILIR